jgi:hypothetical protein
MDRRTLRILGRHLRSSPPTMRIHDGRTCPHVGWIVSLGRRFGEHVLAAPAPGPNLRCTSMYPNVWNGKLESTASMGPDPMVDWRPRRAEQPPRHHTISPAVVCAKNVK